MNIKNVLFIFLAIILISALIFHATIKIIPVELGLADPSAEYNEPIVYHNFVTEEEADYIKTKAQARFVKSEVMGYKVEENIRKSQTAWLEKTDPVVRNVITRVCAIHDYPFENAEELQVVKYESDGFYKEHHDSVHENDLASLDFLKTGGHRKLTMLIYLNDDFSEGGTRFVTLQKDIKPPKYGSILFYPLDKDDRKCHPSALHAGLPLKSGEKYIANVWIRTNEFSHAQNNYVYIRGT